MLVMERGVGCEYINPVPEAQFCLTRSNTDVSLLFGHNVGYSTKYSTKSQDVIDSAATMDRYIIGIERSFANRAKKVEAQPDMTQHQKNVGSIFSFLHLITNFQEVATPMAARYVLKQKQPMFQSHNTTNLIMASAWSVVKGYNQVITSVINYQLIILYFYYCEFNRTNTIYLAKLYQNKTNT
jgi:hypothetical protein